MQSENFKEKLEMGIAGEDLVYPWLKARNSLVQDMRSQAHTEFAGPRLEGTEGSIALPDFAVYNKNETKGNFAVEVKVKTDIYPVKGKMCFTVDEKFEDYKRVVQIMKLDFLVMLFIYKGRMYSYRGSETLGRHYFGTIFGEWGYLFEYDTSKIVY